MRWTKPCRASFSLISISSAESRAEVSFAAIWLSQRGGLRARVADLRLEGSDVLVERAPPRVEQRLLALRVFGRVLGCDTEADSSSCFRRGARLAHELGAQPVLQQAELGIAAHVADHDERLAGTHLLPVAHQDLAHDAALLVLHGLAVELDLDLRRGDDGARQRRGRRPTARQNAATHRREEREAQPRMPAQLTALRIEVEMVQRAPRVEEVFMRPPRAAATGSPRSGRTLRARRP